MLSEAVRAVGEGEGVHLFCAGGDTGRARGGVGVGDGRLSLLLVCGGGGDAVLPPSDLLPESLPLFLP